MAVGDLITGVPGLPQYEFNGILLGSGTNFLVEKAQGLLGFPDLNSTDIDRQDAWGSFPGRNLYKERHITFDVHIVNELGTIETDIQNLAKAFVIQEAWTPPAPIQFVYQRKGGVKRFLWAVCEKFDFDSAYEVSHGHASGSIMLKCNDPRKYSLIEYSDPVTIANATTQSPATNVTNNGTIPTAPILDIVGPCTNPRITNSTDVGRQIKVDIVVPTGQTLEIDLKARTITLQGADVFNNIRSDNQWWKLQPGINVLTYARSDASAASTMTVRHRDAWLGG